MNTVPHQPDPSQDEQQLIAFHLGEPCDERAIRARLEQDAGFAALSEEITHTLRVFSAGPVPQPDTEVAWQRLRATLPPHQPSTLRRFFFRDLKRGWLVPAASATLALLLILFGVIALRSHRRHPSRPDQAEVIRLRPPQGARNPAEAEHLDRAERWLTVVNHSNETLDPATRAEGRQLLTRNAVYLQSARARGDLPDVAVLDRLDRVLTTSNHPAEGGLQLRLDMNTDGLLFQIRILRQNQTEPQGDSQ